MAVSAPRVSVVMGVYNGEPFLDETIRSVVAQTFEDWELVVVDDGSTDATPALLQAWSRREPRVRVIRQANSGKPAGPRNRGIREARGGIITFLDGDDLYHREKLARQVEIFDALPGVGAVFHDFRWFKSGSAPSDGARWFERVDYLRKSAPFFTRHHVGTMEVLVGTPDFVWFMTTREVGVHTSSIAVRREVLASVDQPPFEESLPHGEDVHLWIRIAARTTYACLDQPLSFYRFHPRSWVTTQGLQTLAVGMFLVKRDVLARMERALTPVQYRAHRERLAESWYRIGYRCLAVGSRPEARRSFGASLARTRSARLAWRGLKGLVASLLPREVTRGWWRLRGGGECEVRQGP